MFKTATHIGAAKPVRMTTKIFYLLFPGLTFKTVSHFGAAKPWPAGKDRIRAEGVIRSGFAAPM